MVWEVTNQITFTQHSNTKVLLYFTSVVSVLILFTSLTWFLPLLVQVGARGISDQKMFIIDTDPGIDDAVAILSTLGDSSANVLAITCVRGNTDKPNVVINTLKILRVANKMQISVYAGSNSGLVLSPELSDWFGSDGFGDLPFPNPPSPRLAQNEHAASFLARIVKEYPGLITIIAVGPLTNIALALHLNPQFLHQVRRVVIMGGSIRGYGNTVPGVEFNFYMDPDAASLVLNKALECETTITIVPAETCRDNDLGKEWRWKEVADINNSVVRFLNKLEGKHAEIHPTPNYIPYDAYAAAVALHSESVILSEEFFGGVEMGGQNLRGALFVDYINITMKSANLNIILEVNTTVIKKQIIDNLSNFS